MLALCANDVCRAAASEIDRKRSVKSMLRMGEICRSAAREHFRQPVLGGGTKTDAGAIEAVTRTDFKI